MSYINTLLFFTVILFANIMQGITGFAGTILAMPFSLILMGYPVAKPILNVLGLLSGVYVFMGFRDRVNWCELRNIVIVMTVGIFLGIFIKGSFAGREILLYKALGVFVILLSFAGLLRYHKAKDFDARGTGGGKNISFLLLPMAGIVHGIFVSGGPLLISYLTRRITDKTEFRATISTVWIILNSIVLFDDIRAGFWNMPLCVVFAFSLPFLFAGMKIGSILYSRMSQRAFMVLTYVLLFISGVTLLLK